MKNKSTPDAELDDNVLRELARTLESRKGADAGTSYVASLYSAGLDQILRKLGEESIEAS